MLCKKCKKEISDGSKFCNWCGKKQEVKKRTAHRRPHGTGTIKIDSRVPNKYRAMAPATKNGSGRKHIGSFATYAEADRALRNYIDGIHPDLYNETLSEIYDRWSVQRFPALSDSSSKGYQAAYKSIEELHSIKMRELRTADFQRCVNIAAESFSRSKCEKIRHLCSQLCKYAMQNDLIDKNYAEFIRLPKEKKKEKRVFTKAELKTLWEDSDDYRVRVILFMCYTGFRIGEVFTIKKVNVHLDEGYIIGGLKTEAGTDRLVPLRNEIKPFVEQWIAESKTELMLNGGAANYRKRKFYPVLAQLGIVPPPEVLENGKLKYNTEITPHCCRHTFASMSAEAGMPPEVLQKIIGHASYKTTADIYIHDNLEQLRSGMDLLKI